MQRVHISAALGKRKVDAVRTEDLERLARALLAKGRARADPDLRFLTPTELDAVIGVIPDVVVDRDSLGPALRLVILTAGTPASGGPSSLACAGARRGRALSDPRGAGARCRARQRAVSARS